MAEHEAVTSLNPDRDPSLGFAEQSHLAYLIPSTTDLDLDEAFKNVEQGQSILQALKQRETLLFDETVDVLLILKASWLGEEKFQAQLSRLVISVEVSILNGGASDPTSPVASDTIFQGTVPDVSDPFVVLDEEESVPEGEASQYVYAVWKMPVFLARPRMRVLSPSVVFTASAGLKPDLATELSSGGKGYLPSGLPSGFNLLESFRNDPALNGVMPKLSALRVSRVAPVTRQQDLVQHIRSLQQLKLKINPIIHSRIRFSRPNTASAGSAIVAILEVDFTSHFDCQVMLDKIRISVPDSTVSCLNDDAAMKLPLTCVANDHITFLYYITPYQLDSSPSSLNRELNISISALAELIPNTCTPRLDMKWTTTIDFTPQLNPSFGPPTITGGMQRSHRPSQLSIGGGPAVNPLKSPSLTRPDAIPALEAATTHTETTLPDLGITMSFNAPSSPVRLGESFSWTVYVVNRSSEKNAHQPRKLALVAVPKRRRNEVRSMRPPSSSSRRRGEKEIADAVLDENILHAMQKNSVIGSTEVVCLSADTRVGPLAPGACHVVELEFLALKVGVVGLEAIRVVDLGSQEHVDIRDLPTMTVKPADA